MYRFYKGVWFLTLGAVSGCKLNLIILLKITTKNKKKKLKKNGIPIIFYGHQYKTKSILLFVVIQKQNVTVDT